MSSQSAFTIVNHDKAPQARAQSGNLFLDTANVPWSPFFLDGVDFKILWMDGETVTMLARIRKGVKLAAHQHRFAVELFLLEGTFGYRDDETGEVYSIGPQGYMYEPPGTVHQPVCPEGMLGISILHGPISGFDENGNERWIMSNDIYNRAKEHNAVGHLREKYLRFPD